MQLFLRVVELICKLLTSTLTSFSEIFNTLIDKKFLLVPVAVEPLSRVNNSLIIPGNPRASSTYKTSFMRKSLLFLGTFLSVLFLSIAFSTTAFGQATVTSDKDDYAPRSNAVFTGAGFLPGESVQLKVKNLNRPCNTVSADSSYLPWTVVADADGGFVTD